MANEILDYKAFTTRAILKLRKGEHTNKNGKKVNYRGIHTVFSGYNEAVRQYYGAETDPVEIVNKLVKDGVVETRPGKKGPYLFLKGEAPVPKAETALNAILGV
jgi:hypothetical protein